MANDTTLTPGRSTVLELDGPSYGATRPEWGSSKSASEIGVGPQAVAGSFLAANLPGNVQQVPPGAWILSPLRGETANLMTPQFQFEPIGPSEVITPTNFVQVAVDKQPTDLPGLISPVPTDLPPMKAFVKQVPAGGNFGD